MIVRELLTRKVYYLSLGLAGGCGSPMSGGGRRSCHLLGTSQTSGTPGRWHYSTSTWPSSTSTIWHLTPWTWLLTRVLWDLTFLFHVCLDIYCYFLCFKKLVLLAYYSILFYCFIDLSFCLYFYLYLFIN